MSQQKFHFTKKALEALPRPASKPTVVIDTGCKGLNLIVTPAGNKTFYLRASLKGKQRRFRIGSFPETELPEARLQADEKRSMVAKGIDPDLGHKQQKAEPTLDQFFSEYLELHAKKHKKSWDADEATYRRYLKKPLGGLKLSEITRPQVAHLHLDIGNAGKKSTADHVLALLTALYNKALEWEVFNGSSPSRFTKKYPRVVRKRNLDAEEMKRLLTILANEANTDIRDFTLMALMTGVRRGNILAMRWEEIDWKDCIWHIPMTKNGDGHDVPLHPHLVQLLKTRALSNDSPFVFPGTGKTGHIQKPRHGWKSLMKRAAIDNFTMHDLRRTYGTWVAKTGVSSFIISKSLGHKNAKSAEVYVHMQSEDVRHTTAITVQNMLDTVADVHDSVDGE